MLGWDFSVVPLSAEVTGLRERGDRLASWQTGMGGTDWIDKLCALGKAIQVERGGYPDRYVITAAVLRRALEHGVPRTNSPPTLGEDYFLPAGWTGNAELDHERLNALPAHTLLTIEAWDQS